VSNDLTDAVTKALQCDRAAVRAYAQRYSWNACTEQFIRYLVPLHSNSLRFSFPAYRPIVAV
jgi:hypothetical protein